MPGRSDDVIDFAVRVTELLQHGRKVATYKQAVLMALLDLCLEGTQAGGDPPPMVTTKQAAAKVIELYWQQVRVYSSKGVLRQHNAGQAVVPQKISEVRAKHRRATPGQLARREHKDYERLLRDVEWELVQNPLPRLQVVGGRLDEFIFHLGWRVIVDGKVTRVVDESGERIGKRAIQRPEFRNDIHFARGAAGNLARLHGLLRPLIQRDWARNVAAYNQLEESRLHQFLFDSDRRHLQRVRDPLLDLEGKSVCFYCRKPLGKKVAVDHFVAWARSADDDLANLVVADERCNAHKSDHLAALGHLRRWHERNTGTDIESLADRVGWDHTAGRSLGIARASYLLAPRRVPLWMAGGKFEALDSGHAKRILGAG